MHELKNVRDEDPAPPPRWEGESEPEPARAVGPLIQVMRSFQAMDDAFRYMRAFLHDRGHSSISELDTESRAALIIYLEGVLERLRAERP